MNSVCVATFNGEKYIKKQIESIITQLSAEDEIIISDDGSNDNTISIIENFNDGRIKIFNNVERHGVVPNFENALRHSSGDFIFLSDQDDIWTSNKVQIILEALNNVDLIVHDSMIINGDDITSTLNYYSIRRPHTGYWHNLMRNSFVGSCMAFKRSILDYAMPFPKNILWHDMWIGLMVEKKGTTKFINNKLLYYRRHENNASATGEKSTFSKVFQLKYRLQMLYYSMLR